MSDAWDEMKRAKEDQYFDKLNQEALGRIKKRSPDETKPRISPINGKPMKQEALMGVIVDRCVDTGGIFLDAGELEQILKNVKKEDSLKGDWITSFFSRLSGK
jgi:hypothetical protein